MSIPGRVPASIFGAVLVMAQMRPIFTADYYAVDGVSGKVAAFIDWNDANHTLAQATSGNQVAIPAAHADFAGKLCANFTGALFYVSTRPAASWTFRHDGVSHEEYAIITPTQVTTASVNNTIHDTTDGSTGRSGSILAYSGPTSNGEFVSVQNASSTVAGAGVNGSNTVNTGIGIYLGFGAYASTFARYVKSVSPTTTLSATPLTSAPANTLRLGLRWLGTQGGEFRWRGSCFSPALGPAERVALRSWIQQDTGITP